MEFRKVGDELHLIGKHDIPLFIFGEGYIKRYCLIPCGYKETHCRVRDDTKMSELFDPLYTADILPTLQEYFGEKEGEHLMYLITRMKGMWEEVPVKAFAFPSGRTFTTYTSDYIEDRPGIEIVEEEIQVESIPNGTLIFDKFPKAYSVYRPSDLTSLTPVLSNETIDFYLTDGGRVGCKVKSFPISEEFGGRYLDTSRVWWRNGRETLIEFINRGTFEEQIPTLLGGFKSLIKIKSQYRVPGDKIITRWSKYLGLSPTLRRLLYRNKKTESYRFLRSILVDWGGGTEEQRRDLLRLGEETLDALIKQSGKSCLVHYTLRNITKDNVKDCRELIARYPDFEDVGYDVFNTYRLYKEYRKELRHYDLPLFPACSKDLKELEERLRDEKRIKDEQKPFDNPREELKWEGTEDMFVMVPKCGGDIVKEGIKLHHCVGSYVARVRENVTNIVFIREKKKPKDPFYTVEIDNDYHLVQIRGLQNKEPEPEVRKFLDHYLSQLPSKT